tara:strand:+ start:6424 stop:6768 length:345 start_codon:yes stop_codon:yes gene_type:complete
LVTVRLTDDSKIGRLNITPKQEITRKDEATVSVKWSVVRLSDPNLFFRFDEEDREELLGLNEKLVLIGCREIGKDISTVKELADELLPKKEKSKPKPKPKPKPKAKTPSKTKKE